MLRCTGCDGPVSEWAARCPACGHPTDDAREVADRPARRPGRYLTVILAGTVLAAAVTSAVVATAPRRSAARTTVAPPPGLAGRVLARGPGGSTFLVDPGGGHRRGIAPRALRPGDRLLTAGAAGPAVGVSGASSLHTAAIPPLPRGSSVVDPDPLTAGGGAVIVRSGAPGAGLAAVPVGGGPPAPLGGGALAAAGDPRALGAFVATGDAVQLRDYGRPEAVLATAGQLNRLTDRPDNQPARLALFPDRAGGQVAVVLNPEDGSDSNAPVVILSRTGQVIAAVSAASGPIAASSVFWSPDGRSLAYTTFGSGGTALAVLSGDQIATQGFQPFTRVDGCAWAPDDAWVLCQASSFYTSNWVLARNDAALEPIYSYPAPGARAVPLAWLP